MDPDRIDTKELGLFDTPKARILRILRENPDGLIFNSRIGTDEIGTKLGEALHIERRQKELEFLWRMGLIDREDRPPINRGNMVYKISVYGQVVLEYLIGIREITEKSKRVNGRRR